MKDKIQAVIIEDSQTAQHHLLQTLEKFAPHVQVCGSAGSVVEGAKLIQSKKPEIIFLDVELPDGSGFDILDLLPDQLKSTIIFTTGSEEHALQAFRYAAIDYLLKPIDPDDLLDAISRSAERSLSTPEMKELFADAQEDGTLTRITLHTSEAIIITKIIDIVRCQSYDNYTNVILSDDRKILITKPLKHFDELLSRHDFIRVHQSHLINLEYISSYVRQEGGYLILKDGTNIPVSMRQRREVIKALEG